MKIGYAVLAASIVLSTLPGAAQTAFRAALGGRSVGHFLRGFSAAIERRVDPNQEGDADRPAGAHHGGAWRDVRDRNWRQYFEPEDRPDPERPVPLKQAIREAASPPRLDVSSRFQRFTRGSAPGSRAARLARQVGTESARRVHRLMARPMTSIASRSSGRLRSTAVSPAWIASSARSNSSRPMWPTRGVM